MNFFSPTGLPEALEETGLEFLHKDLGPASVTTEDDDLRSAPFSKLRPSLVVLEFLLVTKGHGVKFILALIGGITEFSEGALGGYG